MQTTDCPRSFPRKNLGFTLVELLVSLTIVLSLVSMASALYSSYARDTNIQVLHSNLFMLRSAIQRFYQDHRRYPIHGRDFYGNLVSFLDDGSSELTQGIRSGAGTYPKNRRTYLQEIPRDPTTNLVDWKIFTQDLSVVVTGSTVNTKVVTNVTSNNPAFSKL